MKLGILQTGLPPAELAHLGRYDAMVRHLLGEGFAYRTYDAQASELPSRPEECDAYLITGSSAGIYDPLPWIAPLIAFLRGAKGRAKLVGICFGHQAMAEAFGGQVVKSEKGTALGLHDYAIVGRRPWMDAAETVRIAASHGDQVVAPPPATTVLARSEFTPYAALVYEDQPAISVQFHPEFDAGVARALTEWQRAKVAPERHAAALASFDRPDDRRQVGAWIRRFLRDESA